jgi:hypothetical protein
VNMTWTNLDPLACILYFLKKFSIASKLVCSLCDAVAESLSVATTAVLSANVAVIDSGEAGKSAVYSKYINGSMTLPCGTPALTGKSSVYSVSTFTRKCLLCK